MNPWPIAPLGPKDLSFTAVNYDFTGLTADELSDLPSLERWTDFLLNEMGTNLMDQVTLIGSMASDLDDLGNVLNELQTDDFGQILADLAGIAAAGDAMLKDFGDLIG